MACFDDDTNALEQDADDHVTIEIVNLTVPGTALNVGETGTFDVQLRNSGPLRLADGTVKIKGSQRHDRQGRRRGGTARRRVRQRRGTDPDGAGTQRRDIREHRYLQLPCSEHRAGQHRSDRSWLWRWRCGFCGCVRVVGARYHHQPTLRIS